MPKVYVAEQAALDALETTVAGHSTTLASNGSTITSNTVAINALDTRVDALETVSAFTSGTSLTLALTDDGGAVEMNSASATTVTVPPNSSVAFPVGSTVEVTRIGAGTVTIVAGSGVTLQSRAGLLAIGNQYGSVMLRKRATNTWIVIGDLA